MTPPFKEWRLPPALEVKFVVSRSKTKRGDYETMPSGKHCIRISAENHAHTDSLLQTVAHEMVHLHQAHNQTPGRRSDHGEEFLAFARQVCEVHGFDEKAF
jgi:hypothetical protein